MNLSGHHGHCSKSIICLLILVNLIPLINYAEANSKKTSYACEGTNLRLDCEYGKVIHLIRAIYGRFSITICNENGNTDWSVNCGSPKSILILNGTCNYQRSCTVMASTKTFGDSCPGTVKYLEVQYQCISANSLMSTTKSPIGGNNKSPWLNNHNPILVNADNNKSLLTTTTTVATTSQQQQVNKVNSGDSYFEADIDNLFHQHNNNNQSISTTNIPLLITKTFLTDASPTLQNENNLTEKYEDEKHFDTIDDKVKVNEDGSTETWDWVSQFNDRNRNRETDSSGGIHKTIWSTSNVASDNDKNTNGDKTEMEIDTSLSSLPTISSSPSLNSNAAHNNHYDEEHENNSHDLDIQDRENCEAKLDRGMFWNWTLVGETAKQPCPGGASGLARWKCLEDPENDYIPSWFPDSPDLSDCKSAWLLSLQARVLEGDRISNVASDLAQVTSTKQMYGGDIAAAVKIIKTIATRMSEQLRSLTNQVSREDLASELLELILEAGSNLLEKARLEPWRDLSYADQMKIATELLVGLEDNAFLLANVINSEKVARKSSKNILATIYSIEANNIREINFPSESKNDHWSKMGDILTMPTEALRENSDGGIVRLVCFAYNNLEHVLQPTGSTSNFGEVRKLVNSRVISASLNQGRHIQLALPVQLTLRHLWVDNVSNPQCVFWDYTQDKWSEEGCRIVKTNRTHTICQCTHLTNFAVLMDLKPPVNIPPSQILQIVVYVGSAVVILCLIFTLIITQFFITGKVFQTMISKNLFICMLIVELVYAFGLHQTSRPMLCNSLTFVMHYFALATILWLFLHGFHLYLIVMEAAENGISRQIWYYGVSYGSPAIVVLLSFLLDPRSYRSDKFCWIQTSFALLCFVGPAAIVACGTAAVLFYTSYKICLLLTAMPKPKPNEDMSLYSYVGSWVRGCLLVLILLTITWTLRLLELESSSSTISYSASVALAIQGIFILIFHIFKSDDMIGKMCDCGTSSDSSDTEMSIHSQQQLQGTLHSQQVTGGPLESSSCHNNAMAQSYQRTIDSSHRNTPDFRIPENIYAKHNIQPSPGGLSTGHRYGGDLGLYSKGGVGLVDGIWTRGNSYSDISRAGYLRSDPVYEEIEKSMSPRASGSDISLEDDLYSPHHHDIDIYNRRLYGQHQARNLAHYHHHHQHNPHHSNKSRKVDLINVGEEINPLLRIQQQQLLQQQMQQSQHHYSTNRHRPVGTSDHHHLKGIHPNPDEQILQNVHMV